MNWLMILLASMVVGALFSMVMVFTLSRSATGGDLDWQIARLERKVDLILTHLGISHDDHVPEIVIGLAQAGRKLEAIKEYRKLTGASLSVAKREVEYVIEQLGVKKSGELFEP